MTETLSITSKTTDFELTQAACKGNMMAFEEIYTRHHRRVHSICLRMLSSVSEAEDLTQDVFIQLYRKIGIYHGDLAFTTWLHRLTVNQVLMHFRKRSLTLDEDAFRKKFPQEFTESDTEPTPK